MMSSVNERDCLADDAGSGLLRRLRLLGLCLPVDLERLAIRRGLEYYDTDHKFPATSNEVALSNGELAIALLLPSLVPSGRQIRLAAALLGSPDLRPDEVAPLAVDEGCADIVRYIALSGRTFEPDNSFWHSLLELLPEVDVGAKVMPHPTRFVEMTGIDRGKVGRFTRWIRPRIPAAA